MKKSVLREIIKEELWKYIHNFGNTYLPKKQTNLYESLLLEKPESKDIMRINDMVAKAAGNGMKLASLATQMAKVIKDGTKAARRFEAAEAILGDKHQVTKIFKARAIELGYIFDDNPDDNKNNPGGKGGTIYLPTNSALTLWETEILGQLSDGAWENTRPFNHWRFWSDLNVKKGKPEVKGGGWAERTGYNLAGLYEYVGPRMVAKGRLAKALNKVLTDDEGYAAEGMEDFKTFEDYQNAVKNKSAGYMFEKYTKKKLKVAQIKKYFETNYTKTDMYNDLKFIKAAMKTARTWRS